MTSPVGLLLVFNSQASARLGSLRLSVVSRNPEQTGFGFSLSLGPPSPLQSGALRPSSTCQAFRVVLLKSTTASLTSTLPSATRVKGPLGFGCVFSYLACVPPTRHLGPVMQATASACATVPPPFR